VLVEARRLKRGSMRTRVGILRTFVRFLFVTGVTARDLSACVLQIARARFDGLPKPGGPRRPCVGRPSWALPSIESLGPPVAHQMPAPCRRRYRISPWGVDTSDRTDWEPDRFASTSVRLAVGLIYPRDV
jgi:hypothetical protein